MYLAICYTESGDHYYHLFREKPSDEFMTEFLKERYPDEFVFDSPDYIEWTYLKLDLED